MVALQKVLGDTVHLLGATGSSPIYGARTCCEKLSQALPDRVTFPYPGVGQSDAHIYDALNTNRWSEGSILAPSCIFTPSTTSQVAKGVEILSNNNCKFSIKSGGHMAFPGANNINDGISLDLSWLNSTSLAEDRSFVSLQTGLTWGEAYASFANDGVLFPGGICASTGIGGLSTGGGMSVFQPKVGWVVDNILNYEVVLGSGEVVNANQTSHSDLYRALKGGSSNFGVVTRVDLATFEESPIWAGQVTVPAVWPNIGNSLRGLEAYTTQNNHEIHAGVQMGFGYLSNGLQIIDVALASTDGTVQPDVLKPFAGLRLQLRNSLDYRSMASFTKEAGDVQPQGWREVIATVTIHNDLKTLEKVHAISDEIYKSIKHVPGLDYIFMYIPQPRIIQDFAAQRGGNMLGLEGLDHDQISVFLSPRYKDAEYDDVVNDAAERWAAQVEEAVRPMGTFDPFLYLGFAGSFQKPLCTYGEKNVQFMKDVAAKYDPNQVFQKLVPGGFKLSNAC